ncbi:kinetoplast-associated protein, putative [Trypanosoma brucei gambiense DAL972]|uniref:Kinetoplast-associated protein, putative n=2 Tax=Trypanozoon TaxID=39700 RepID=C9ZWM4_TRYB9|nr:kinetoplast-associated protein, putative [Trypanosoma brucei gambiense DAL972]CBH13813.1 kinetoplast-associated protein, putative [Trypanosoma brucei gambiense DAL972]|eukprot:XP_011776089.1 kinetoplast-associated protein, putative [Trypanosoma brucei gambiense DAL972]
MTARRRHRQRQANGHPHKHGVSHPRVTSQGEEQQQCGDSYGAQTTQQGVDYSYPTSPNAQPVSINHSELRPVKGEGERLEMSVSEEVKQQQSAEQREAASSAFDNNIEQHMESQTVTKHGAHDTSTRSRRGRTTRSARGRAQVGGQLSKPKAKTAALEAGGSFAPLTRAAAPQTVVSALEEQRRLRNIVAAPPAPLVYEDPAECDDSEVQDTAHDEAVEVKRQVGSFSRSFSTNYPKGTTEVSAPAAELNDTKPIFGNSERDSSQAATKGPEALGTGSHSGSETQSGTQAEEYKYVGGSAYGRQRTAKVGRAFGGKGTPKRNHIGDRTRGSALPSSANAEIYQTGEEEEGTARKQTEGQRNQVETGAVAQGEAEGEHRRVRVESTKKAVMRGGADEEVVYKGAGEARTDVEEEAARRRAEEVARRRAAAKDVLMRRAEEAARKRAEKVAQRRAEHAARRKVEEEARKRVEGGAQKAAEEVARKNAEEAARKKAEEAARKKAEEEARKKAEEEARKKAEEAARKKAEEAARKKAEEAARKRAEEAARKKAEEAARKKAEEEARKRAEEEARKKAEEAARKRAEEAARKKAEEAARKKAEEEARKKAEEAARKKAEEEARKKAEEAARKRAEEAARKKAEEAARKKAEEEARKKAEEAARKKAEEEARKKAEEEARRMAEEARRMAEEEEEARRMAEEEAVRKRVEREVARKKAEEVARRRAEQAVRKKAEEVAARKRAEEEAARRMAEEEEARRMAEEENLERGRAVDGAARTATGNETTLTEQQRRERAKKKLERYRKQALARNQRPAWRESDAAAAAAAAVAQGAADVPFVPTRGNTILPSEARAASTSEEELIAGALTFPNSNVAIEKFDENQLVVRRQSLDDPWDIGLRFDWTIKTLAIGSLPTYRLTDPRRMHPFMRMYQSKPVWFLEEVNGTKANNIREVMEVLKKSLLAKFVFRKPH